VLPTLSSNEKGSTDHQNSYNKGSILAFFSFLKSPSSSILIIKYPQNRIARECLQTFHGSSRPHRSSSSVQSHTVRDTAASILFPPLFKLVDYISHGVIEHFGDDYHIRLAWCVICSPKQHVNYHRLPATCTPLLRTCQRIPFQDSEGKICARGFSSFHRNDKNLFI
jgi:hypothetical protein